MRPTKLREINERTISTFVKGMRERKRPGGKVGLAPMTIRNYLIALKTTLHWAVEQRFLSDAPAFPEIRVPKRKPQPIPQEDFDKLVAQAPDQLWRAFLLCGWWGGLRLSEAQDLRWCPSTEFPWVDFERGRIVLPATFAKSAEDQWVPLHLVLRTALETLPRTADRVFPFRSAKTKGPLTRNGATSRVIL